MAQTPGKPAKGTPGSSHSPADDKTDPELIAPPVLREPFAASSPGLSPGSPGPASPPSAPVPPTAAPRGAIRMPELGALDSLMKDPSITEIMVNDTRNVMIEREGKMSFSGLTFTTIDDLNRLTRSILDFTGRILTYDHPYVDLSLPDGSRVNIVGPPLTASGPCLTIRKFPSRRLNLEDLLGMHSVDKRIAYFLSQCVIGRLNILISGGTGSGKTTLLNALLAYVPRGERIITIEDTPELAVLHPNSVRLFSKPQSPTLPAITARELLANSLRMRPDRIVVGECRRGEAFDMLQAMNTGHAGSMTTVHANSPRDALARVETLALLGGVDLPLLAIRKQIASALDLVIQIKRFRSGHRAVVAVAEVTGVEGDIVTMQDIFSYELVQKANSPEVGVFKCTGFLPKFVDQLKEQGIEFPRGFFA